MRLNGSSEYRNVYRKTASRWFAKVARDEFCARTLTADDHALLEHVRKYGSVACGSLADLAPTEVYCFDLRRHRLLEEQEFWERPYTHEKIRVKLSVELSRIRKAQKLARRAEYKERLQKIQAERIAKREAQRAMAQEALEEERKAWRKEQADLAAERERRRMELSFADREWEAATPTHRHYVPEWKREETKEPWALSLRKKSKEKQLKERVDTIDAEVEALRKMAKDNKPRRDELSKVTETAMRAARKRRLEIEAEAEQEAKPESEPAQREPEVRYTDWDPDHPERRLPRPAPGHMFILWRKHIFVRTADCEKTCKKFGDKLTWVETRDLVVHFVATDPDAWVKEMYPQ
jgi:hypothetical protein